MTNKTSRFFSLVLCVLILFNTSGIITVNSVSATTESNILVDEFNSFTKMNSHSKNLKFIKTNSNMFNGDKSRLCRTKKTTEYIVYKMTKNIACIMADTYFESKDKVFDFKFYVSEDGENYSILTPAKTVYGGGRYRVKYETSSIPSGSLYLKIEISGTSKQILLPQISRLQIIYGTELLSANKKVTSSSFMTGKTAEMGNDKNIKSTRWSASSKNMPQWWMVDLGDTYQINIATINWYLHTKAYWKYEIVVSNSSDGRSYQSISYSSNKTKGNTTNNLNIKGRYVGIIITGCSIKDAWASFYECKIFGNEIPGYKDPIANVSNDAQLADALENENVKTIIFDPSQSYRGFCITHPVSIVGNGATITTQGVIIDSSDVVIDNLNIKLSNITDGYFAPAYTLGYSSSGIEIKNGSIDGSANKLFIQGFNYFGSPSDISIDNVDFINLQYGIVGGYGVENSESVLSLTNCEFTNVDFGIEKTEGFTIKEMKDNKFINGIQGIGLRDGMKVDIAGQDIYSIASYIKSNNIFEGYIEENQVMDYRYLSTEPTPTPTEYILFIGNSLTFSGDVPAKFSDLAKQTGKQIGILEKLEGGYRLYEHYADLKSGDYDEMIKKADIVILQEYGQHAIDTVTVANIQKLFDADTKFYYQLTDWNGSYEYLDFDATPNVKYIPSPDAMYLLLENGFTYEQFHKHSNDYHPNDLYGYLIACATYARVFNTTCVGLPFNFLDLEMQQLIPGSSYNEKSVSIQKIQQAVMDVINLRQDG